MLLAEKARYLAAQKEKGGTAPGYREFVRKQYGVEPEKYDGLLLEMLMESAKRAWERPARFHPDSLFVVKGIVLPEFITRPSTKLYDAGEDDDQFEKVDTDFTTVGDIYAYGTLQFRLAAQSTARAETTMKAADEARRRASGDLNAYMRDLFDKAWSAAA